MCGISGIFSSRNIDLQKKFIYRSCKNLSRRGPDFSDTYVSKNQKLILSHNKLSITDSSFNSNQPKISSCGRYVVSYNGEIYNYKKIRYEIQKYKNYKFKSTGDTEVLIEAISLFGISEMLKKIDGMFAMSILDNHTNKLYLITDFFGEKPIYYYFNNNNFFFSSSLNCIKDFTSKEIDNNSLKNFFIHKYIPREKTIYKDISKMLPGQLLILNFENDNKLQLKKESYKSINDLDAEYEFNAVTNDDVYNDFRKILSESILERAQKNCAVFLSGGVDSSLIASILQENNQLPIQTFSIGFEKKDDDESEKIKLVSKIINCKNERFQCTNDDLRSAFQKISFAYDEPFSDSSQLPTLILSDIASKFTRVCLAGDGADELFGGYSRYQQTEKKWGYRNYFKFLNLFFRDNLIKKSTKLKDLKFLYSNKNFLKFYIHNGWLNHNHNHFIKNFSIDDNYKENINLNSNDYKNMMMSHDKENYLPYDILVKMDRASMYNSLEVRLPFLSQKIFNFSKYLYKNFKNSEFKNKQILRKTLSNYLPDKIYNQKKKGFSFDLRNFLLYGIRDISEEALKNTKYLNDEIFDQSKLQLIWQNLINGDKTGTSLIYSYVVFNQWLKNQKNNG